MSLAIGIVTIINALVFVLSVVNFIRADRAYRVAEQRAREWKKNQEIFGEHPCSNHLLSSIKYINEGEPEKAVFEINECLCEARRKR